MRLCFLLLTLLVHAAVAADAPALSDDNTGKVIKIGTEIVLTVDRLQPWLENRPADPAKPAQPRKVEDLRIWVDGAFIPQVTPSVVQPNAKDKTASDVHFWLNRLPTNEANKKVWATLITRQMAGGEKRQVHISVGPESGAFVSGTKANIDILSERSETGYWIGLGVSAILLIFAAWRTNLIRDTGPLKPGLAADTRTTFSLSKLQMALWFFVVTHGFIYICLANRGADIDIPATTLGLMGISAATGFAATVMSSSKRDEAQAQLSELVALIAKKNGAIVLTTEEATRLGVLTAKKNDLETQAFVCASANFFKDLLHDGKAISLHRIQMLVWTLIVVVIFGEALYHTVNFPPLSDTLLGLMGLSGGAYLGFKFPEKQ